MNEHDKTRLGKTLWAIADRLRGAMNADDFRDYMLSFLFLRYLSDTYEDAAQKELGADWPQLSGDDRRSPLAVWYSKNPDDIKEFEAVMRRKVHYVIKPEYLWSSIAEMARTQDGELLATLQAGFKYIEEESFQSNFQGLFSEINLASDKLGRKYDDRNAKLCSIISELARGMAHLCPAARGCITVVGLHPLGQAQELGSVVQALQLVVGQGLGRKEVQRGGLGVLEQCLQDRQVIA